MEIISKPSPNYNERPRRVRPDTLVLHYTGMETAQEALEKLCDKEAQVSSHYLVDEEGQVYELVKEEYRAWHAGVSHWRGRDGVNDFSVGIEIVNPGHEFGYHPFPEDQMKSVIALSQDILKRHPIPSHNVVGHSDIAPTRKEDPGELFDWAALADAGIGVFHNLNPRGDEKDLLFPGDRGQPVTALQEGLQLLGYKISPHGQYDLQTEKVVSAFKRRYYPKRLDAVWDEHSEAILKDLHKTLGA